MNSVDPTQQNLSGSYIQIFVRPILKMGQKWDGVHVNQVLTSVALSLLLLILYFAG